jgi:hypothetical protein
MYTMQLTILPHTYYSFINPSADVAPYSSGFYQELMLNQFTVIDNIRVQEYFMKKLCGYKVLTDINRLHRQLVRIHLEILNTPLEDRLTYKEYMEKYFVDCIAKSLLCRGLNPKPLMIAFDNGYRNINSIPQVTTSGYGGISWFGISDSTPEINDFIID